MTFTENFQGLIPEARKPATRLGVADGSGGHAKLSLDQILTQSLDDGGCCLSRHDDTMPRNLASIKPNDPLLRQESWRATIRAMGKDEKPFADIAERLLWHRTFEGLTQKEYATKAGLTRNQLSNWETGDSRLSLDGALALRRTYGLSLDFIYEGNAETLPMTLRAAWLGRS